MRSIVTLEEALRSSLPCTDPMSGLRPEMGNGMAKKWMFRRLFVTCDVFVRYSFVAFPWLFRGPHLLRKTVFGRFSWLFRGFFVALILGKFYAYSPWKSLLRCWPHREKGEKWPKMAKLLRRSFLHLAPWTSLSLPQLWMAQDLELACHKGKLAGA